MSCFVAFHYRSYGTFFLHKNKLHNIYSGFTHYKYYRAKKLTKGGQFFNGKYSTEFKIKLVKEYHE
ncbi:hypothetical protein RQW89_00540, partial [Streptococcus pneumoniae]|nr:hypothetical protein [Streptococcus pneumoniae]MDS2666173.1 hypothetical protein [Streptococcus pneumoniae]MDS4664571.1 hypothetical protein [Streptococcus pneumoniae]MDS5455748.1 hypothetical protein [Streptococcus pneumoniae]MDS8352301.1 hypothetical protein [Streptococcus pneumoniae]